MYLNAGTGQEGNVILRLTVTLDVFKYIFASGAQNGAFRINSNIRCI